jgi:hypothetical protein
MAVIYDDFHALVALTACIRGAAVAASQRTRVSDLDAVVRHYDFSFCELS